MYTLPGQDGFVLSVARFLERRQLGRCWHDLHPGENHVWLIESDQPVLAADSVRHVHEPVVLLALPVRDG